jgi:hypothetical protein
VQAAAWSSHDLRDAQGDKAALEVLGELVDAVNVGAALNRDAIRSPPVDCRPGDGEEVGEFSFAETEDPSDFIEGVSADSVGHGCDVEQPRASMAGEGVDKTLEQRPDVLPARQDPVQLRTALGSSAGR